MQVALGRVGKVYRRDLASVGVEAVGVNVLAVEDADDFERDVFEKYSVPDLRAQLRGDPLACNDRIDVLAVKPSPLRQRGVDGRAVGCRVGNVGDPGRRAPLDDPRRR